MVEDDSRRVFAFRFVRAILVESLAGLQLDFCKLISLSKKHGSVPASAVYSGHMVSTFDVSTWTGTLSIQDRAVVPHDALQTGPACVFPKLFVTEVQGRHGGEQQERQYCT